MKSLYFNGIEKTTTKSQLSRTLLTKLMYHLKAVNLHVRHSIVRNIVLKEEIEHCLTFGYNARKFHIQLSGISKRAFLDPHLCR